MKEKVLQLEAKVDWLETKVEEQEALLIGLQRQTSAKLAAGKTGKDPLAERNLQNMQRGYSIRPIASFRHVPNRSRH